MKYLKPIMVTNEEEITNPVFQEWQRLRHKLHDIFIYLGLSVTFGIEKNNNGKYYPIFKVNASPFPIQYSILSLLYCVKEDYKDSVYNIEKLAKDNTNAVNYMAKIAISSKNDIEDVIIINPKNAVEGYKQIITNTLEKAKKENYYEILKRYFSLNNDIDQAEIIVDDYIMNEVLKAVGDYKTSYNVVQKIKERRKDLYDKLVRLDPKIENSTDLSTRGYDD